MNVHEEFVGGFLRRMAAWESRCAERQVKAESGEVSSDEKWKANEEEYQELMDDMCSGSPSAGKGESFSTVSGYSIEEVEGSRTDDKGTTWVYTKRFRAGIIDEKYRYEIRTVDGALSLGKRFYLGYEGDWDLFEF